MLVLPAGSQRLLEGCGSAANTATALLYACTEPAGVQLALICRGERLSARQHLRKH